MGTFALRVVCPHINSANCFCVWSEYLRVPAVVIFALHPAKSFDSTGVYPSCVISVTVGIVTALPEEFATVCSVLECQLQIAAAREGGDNVYRLGVIRKEAAAWGIVVAVALLNSMGNVSAAACVTSMVNDCPHLKEIIICGIAGGAARRGVAHSCVSSFHGDAARVFAL